MAQDRTRAIVRMHLDLAHALSERRDSLQLSLEEASKASGLDPERIEMIEEGDTTSLADVAQLCAALRVRLTLSDGFRFTLEPAPRVRWVHGQPAESLPTGGSEAKITVGPKEQPYFEAPHTLAAVS